MTRVLPARPVPSVPARSVGRPGRFRGRPNRRVLAAVLLVVSLAPSMLPRPPWVQAVESLLLVAGGWWLGRRGPRSPAWSAVALVVVLLAELAWQALLWLRTGAGLPGAFVPLTLLVTGGGVLLLRGAPSPRGVARLGIEVVAAVLAHASDPVPVWSPALLVRPPPDGTDADLPRPPWLPVVSFLQTSVDLLVALSVPPGHGHRYGDEQRAAWSVLVRGVMPDSPKP